METLAWRTHFGPIPLGVGYVPKLYDDGAWWVIQRVGTEGVSSTSNSSATRVLRYGMGDTSTGSGDPTSDLQSLAAVIASGDQSLAAGQYATAVVFYQAAGASGANVVGPEIDGQTGGASKPLTQQAWAINGNLAAVNNVDGSATQADAESAQGFVRQMQNLYTQALAMPAAPSNAPSQALLTAAGALVDWLAANGCTQGSIPACATFQAQYNQEGQVNLVVDGKYGAQTQAALGRVLAINGAGTAPPNCFGGSTPTPTKPQSIPPLVITGSGKTNWTPWIIGGAAVGGAGVIGYAYWRKHHKKGSRR